jgi:hypothetical protein
MQKRVAVLSYEIGGCRIVYETIHISFRQWWQEKVQFVLGVGQNWWTGCEHSPMTRST